MKLTRFLAAACLCLLASPSFAASKLFISEYSTLASTNSGGSSAQIAAEPAITDQTPVDFSGGVASSAAFNAGTRYIRLMCDTRCAVKVRPACAGTSASTSNKPLAADTPEYFGVQPLDCISVIASP